MNTRPRKVCARALVLAGNSPLAGCISPRWIRIAALSVITLPSGKTRVGICPSGLTFFSSSIAESASQAEARTLRKPMPQRPSAASAIAEPLPWEP